MSFADLGLAPDLLHALSDKGYSAPTPPIQSHAIPAALAGRDVLAAAQTGTDKTAAFVLPILQQLAPGAGQRPRALVLTPTRELAAQVADSARSYGKYLAVRTTVVFGGVSINPQIEALRSGCDLLVATPGRLLDLAGHGVLDLRSIGCLVLDEADRMLDMGFIQAIRRILKLLPGKRQNLMFSAQLTESVRYLVVVVGGIVDSDRQQERLGSRYQVGSIDRKLPLEPEIPLGPFTGVFEMMGRKIAQVLICLRID